MRYLLPAGRPAALFGTPILLLARVGNFLAVLLVLLLDVGPVRSSPADYFAIQVVDDATGRGVPLVELSTVNHISYWTDSNGWIAFQEPGLMDQEVFFFVRSHGYEYPKDGFGNRGLKLRVKAGEQAVVKIHRLNIAERLYRITGQGIYRDTLLLGRRAPTRQPAFNGQVMGQDTVIATPYRGKIYWFWGDTDRASYPLGNFGGSGATSDLPGHGGLDPEAAVDLTYFVDKNGFSKPMCPDFGPGLQWIESLITLPDDQGRERLIARVASADGLKGTHGWHVAVFNDSKEIFERLVDWPVKDSHDVTTPFRARSHGVDYVYLYPNSRVPAELRSVTNLASYEAYTCLADGARYAGAASRMDRDGDGRIRYAWRRGADRLDGPRLRELIKAGLLQPAESWKVATDVETGRTLWLDRGSVCWNPFRHRWVMIASGVPGEIWFSEADTSLGPWVYARRVLNHDHYNFYNPAQHPFFDQADGRRIYFEGTYTESFSGAKVKTPRYDYNQVMYRLNLDDPRLDLPAPVYLVNEAPGRQRLHLREPAAAWGWPSVVELAFFGVPPERKGEGLVPIFAVSPEGFLSAESRGAQAKPLFLAWPAEAPADESKNEAIVPLYEFREAGGKERHYSTDPAWTKPGFSRADRPLCRVWKNPLATLPVDEAAP
jgi:hypothetical protein